MSATYLKARMKAKAVNIDGIKADAMSTNFKWFAIWTFVLFGRPQDYLTFLVPFRIALVLTAVNIFMVIFKKKKYGIGVLRNNPVGKYYAVLIAIMFIGVPFASHSGRTFVFLIKQYIVNIIYFYVFIKQVDSLPKLKNILYVLSLSAFLYGCSSFILGGTLAGRLTFGTMYDPNDLALFMGSLFPISLMFVSKGNKAYKRIISWCVLVVSPIVILLTGSRGGVLILATMALCLIFTKIAIPKFSQKIILAACVFIAVLANSDSIDMDRFHSLFDIESDYNVTSDTGRLEIWNTAFKLISKNPITGVGVDCFPRAFGFERAAEGRIPIWRAVHNAYLQIWSETGYPGFAVFFLLILTCFKTFFSTYRIKNLSSEYESIKKIGGIMLVSFLGHSVGIFFLSQAYGILLTLYFSITSVLCNIVKDYKKETAIVNQEQKTSG